MNSVLQQKHNKSSKVSDYTFCFCIFFPLVNVAFSVLFYFHSNAKAFKLMLEAVGSYGPHLKPPSFHELRVPLLQKELEYTKDASAKQPRNTTEEKKKKQKCINSSAQGAARDPQPVFAAISTAFSNAAPPPSSRAAGGRSGRSARDRAFPGRD
ncbi:hypothetical protein KIW84_033025 [Lathyrus oleraceus]|uniref:Uncharacterized protein n=1 Tax=Pisum sativum TaxID=3888 RepID=A0A9D5AXF7_PEA|nr:hypothetical protein KIW84_033025 [Pisum sativum]